MLSRPVILFFCALALRAQSADFFEAKVRPVLATSCYGCHSAKAKTPFAGLLLDSRGAMLKGGDHGPVVVPGKPAESRLLQAVKWEGLRMPPAGKLPAEQIADIEKWIAAGAHWPNDAPTTATSSAQRNAAAKHWAWQPLRRNFAKDASIDRFVAERLSSEGLAANPQADRRTLIRRLYHDLTGLPPTAAEIDAFVAGGSLEELIDRLLASPRFGERWGRHWLDLARFSDAGFNNVRFPYAFTYRDWVIEAFNSGMSYHDFVERQLAADQLPGGTPHLPALGFLSLGYNAPRLSNYPDKVDDRIDAVTRTFLGLTVACARCHDHKYDPIPTKDYYSLFGVFANTHEPIDPAPAGSGNSRSPLDSFYLPKLTRHREMLDDYKRQRIEEIRAEARQPEAVKKYLLAAWESRAMTNPQVDALSKERNLNLRILQRWREWMNGRAFDPASAAETATELAASGFLNKPAAPPTVPLDDFIHVLTEGDYNTTNNLRWQRDRIFADYAFRGSPTRAMHVADNERLETARVLIRGNQNDAGDAVPRQFLSLLAGPDRRPFQQGAGRLELARAITDPANPLTARVWVNRVWQYLFGEGLVRTPSDFGARGEAPTHPELLDWLAATFMERDGWSTKKLIRRIVLSDTYLRSSAPNASARAKDPSNRLLWRQNRRRMDFESLRDAMLTAAGKLDTKIGGPSFSLAAIPADSRRTMYAYVERERAQAVLKAFDYADPEQHTAQRFLTTVPQQSLFLMNSPFTMEMAVHVAERSRTLRDLFRNVLGRDPEPAEARTEISGPPSNAPHEKSAWEYGYGHIDIAAGRVNAFTPFRYFVDDAWQAASLLPAREAGNAMLTANGGAPGDDVHHAAIRRWNAPESGKASIKGTLTHTLDQFAQRFRLTNGIRAHVVHSRLGVLGKWQFGPPEEAKQFQSAAVRKTETNVESVDVRAGDTIDFVVDALDDYEADNFAWAPLIELDNGSSWNAAKDFTGPAPIRMGPRDRLAQVLLLTNEFAFID